MRQACLLGPLAALMAACSTSASPVTESVACALDSGVSARASRIGLPPAAEGGAIRDSLMVWADQRRGQSYDSLRQVLVARLGLTPVQWSRLAPVEFAGAAVSSRFHHREQLAAMVARELANGWSDPVAFYGARLAFQDYSIRYVIALAIDRQAVTERAVALASDIACGELHRLAPIFADSPARRDSDLNVETGILISSMRTLVRAGPAAVDAIAGLRSSTSGPLSRFLERLLAALAAERPRQ